MITWRAVYHSVCTAEQSVQLFPVLIMILLLVSLLLTASGFWLGRWSVRQRQRQDNQVNNQEDNQAALRFANAELQRQIRDRKQIEATLKDKATRLSLAVKAAKAGTWEWHQATNQVIWSENNFRLMGYDPQTDESNYNNWLQAIHPDEREVVHQHILAVFERRDDLDLEYRVLLPDGTVRWLTNIGEVTYDEDGLATGMIGIQLDITPRKQSELELQKLNQELEARVEQRTADLQQSERQLATLISNLPGYVHRVVNNRDYTPIFISEGVVHITGYQQSDYLIERITSCGQEIHPDDAEAVWDIVQQAVATHQSYECEYRISTKSGEQKWVWERGRGIYADDGNLIYLEGFVTDISDRKQAEATLRQERNLLSRIMETSPSGITLLNCNGQITFANARAEHILGLTKTEVLSRVYNTPTWQIQDLDGSPFPEDELPFVQVMRSQQPVFNVQHGIQQPNGQVLFLSINAAPSFNASGEIDGVVATLEDITERKQSEQDLQQALATNQALLNAIPDLILRINREGIYTGGFPSQDIPMLLSINAHLGKSLWDILPADLAQQRLEAIEQTFQTNRPQIHEYELWVDGELRYEESRFVICSDDEVMMLVRDITDRKRAEIALRESEARFRQLAENIQEVFWLSDAEISQILYVSPAYEKIWGRSMESIQAEPKSFVNAIHPDDRQRVAGNLIAPDAPFEVEYRVVQPNGEIRWIYDRGFPVFDAAGKVTRRAGLAQDITERKRTEEQLRHLTERLELAIQAANMGIWEWDLATDHLLWDDRMRELYGIQSIDFDEIWAAWETRLHPADRDKVTAVVQQALANGQNYQMEFRIVWPDGSIHHIASYALIQQDTETGSIRLVGANLDISDRKQAELEIHQLNEALEQQNRNLEALVAQRTAELTRRTVQLEASNKELESFSYSVSHDLRAPLRHIHGFVNALQQRLQEHDIINDAKVVHYLQVIENSSQKMALLIDGLLTLSRIGRKPIVYAPVVLRQLVDEAIEITYRSSEIANPIEFVIGDLPTVSGDATLLQQVLNNLISNAIKFSHHQAHPRIEMGCLPDGTLFIKDNGVGFQMKYADKLFGAFQRLHAQSEFEGTGIGLAIVQRIIHRHGGTIWAESEPNEGTVFYFTLDNIS